MSAERPLQGENYLGSTIPDRTVTSVSWRDLCPWLIIFRCLAVAASFSSIAIAWLAVVATPVGWNLAERLFLNEDVRQLDPHFSEFVAFNRSPSRWYFDNPTIAAGSQPPWFTAVQVGGVRQVYQRMVAPVAWVFRGELGPRRFAYLIFGAVWSALVWSFAGVAIARYSVLQLTRDETLSLWDVWEFSVGRWSTTLGAIGSVAALVVALTLPGILVGLLLASNWGAMLGAVLWPAVILCGCGLALVLVGLFLAWPLIVASISAENQNALDAVTRSLAYVYQRPLSYFAYAVLALLVGTLGWIMVYYLATLAIHLTYWTGSWGANVADPQRVALFQGGWLDSTMTSSRGAEVIAPLYQPREQPVGVRWAGGLIRFWNGLVPSLAVACLHALFWSLATAVYLLMRYDVDQTEMDEVFLDEERRVYELPPLKSDEQGVPQVQRLEDYWGQREEDSD